MEQVNNQIFDKMIYIIDIPTNNRLDSLVESDTRKDIIMNLLLNIEKETDVFPLEFEIWPT